MNKTVSIKDCNLVDRVAVFSIQHPLKISWLKHVIYEVGGRESAWRNPMPEYIVKQDDIMIMFKSLVSNTDQGTNQGGDNR